MKSALLYARVSTDEQATEGFSIQAQSEKLKAYATIQDWAWEIFVDDGYSGKDLERPGIQKIIKKVTQKQADYVVVVKLDRLSRKQKDILYLIEDVFEPNGVSFVSITESFDTSTAFGKAALGMLAVFAQLERETIIERSRTGKAQAAKHGRWHGGIPPYGYRYSDTAKSEIEPDPLTAPIVEKIYQKYLSGDGYQAITIWLNDNNIPTIRGGKWVDSTVKGILTNPVYIGWIRHKGTLYEGKHEPILTEEIWNAVQKEIKQRKNRTNSTTKRKHSLLPGVIYCGECGARMRTKNIFQNYPKPGKLIGYYVCYSQDRAVKRMVKDPNCRAGYKHVEDIDRKVIDKLISYSMDETALDKSINKAIAKYVDGKANMLAKKTAIEKELTNVKGRINRWYDAFETGEIDNDSDAIERLNKLKERRGILEKELLEIEEEINSDKERENNIACIRKTIKSLPIIWEKATIEEKQEILRIIVKKVTVYKDGTIDVKLNL